MKGICRSCGQRVRVSGDDDDNASGLVVNCPQCGVPVKVGKDKTYMPSSKPLFFASILLSIAVCITIYYAIRRGTYPQNETYEPNQIEQIAYALALILSFTGFFTSLFGVLTNIVERHKYMLTMLMNLALLVFWAVFFLT